MNSNDILIANTDDLRSDMNYLEKTLLKGHRIDPNLYEEYDVKRGLRGDNFPAPFRTSSKER